MSTTSTTTFMPISPVSTAVSAFTFHTWTGHPSVSTTFIVPHTHTRWTDPSPPYSWPPPGYSSLLLAIVILTILTTHVGILCECAPQCGYQAVVTEDGSRLPSVTSLVTAPPSTVVITQTQTQPQTTMFIQPPTQTVMAAQAPRLYTDSDRNHCAGGFRCATESMGDERGGQVTLAQPGQAPVSGQVSSVAQSGLQFCMQLRKTNLTELTILQIVRFTSVMKDYAQEFRYATNG